MENNWISANDRLPLSEDKKKTRFVLVTDGHMIYRSIYWPYKFRMCTWENLDELDDEAKDEDLDLIGEDYWMKEGWWYEYEHRGDYYQRKLEGIISWRELPEPSKDLTK